MEGRYLTRGLALTTGIWVWRGTRMSNNYYIDNGQPELVCNSIAGTSPMAAVLMSRILRSHSLSSKFFLCITQFLLSFTVQSFDSHSICLCSRSFSFSYYCLCGYRLVIHIVTWIPQCYQNWNVFVSNYLHFAIWQTIKLRYFMWKTT